jgi:hypothetical protein
MDDQFLSFCQRYENQFESARAVRDYLDQHPDSDLTNEEATQRLGSSSQFKQRTEDEFESLASIFAGASFLISPLPVERQNNFLLLGHRAVPYYNAGLTNDQLELRDEFGDVLSTSTRDLPWHVIKKYNLGAPFQYQVQPGEVDISEICRKFVHDSDLSGISLFPEVDEGSGKDVAYQLDMHLSELELNVKTYQYQIPQQKWLRARVEDYESGVLSIRPADLSPDELDKNTDEFHSVLVEALENTSSSGHRVMPFLTDVLSEHRKFLRIPCNHWIHVVLESETLQLRQPGVDPEIHDHSQNDGIRTELAEFLMKAEFQGQLEEYREDPGMLVEDACEAYQTGGEPAELYLWLIEQVGADCHDPLLDLLKSETEQEVVFAVTALEATWSETLEQPLKFIASDDRLTEETRNGAMYLLVNYGSESAREYTSRMVQDTGMAQGQLDTEELFQSFIHTPDARIELLHSEEPNREAMLQELIKVDDPRLVFIGATLVYSSRKSFREIGREALMRSGVPLVRQFVHDLKDSPIEPIRRMAGTPMVEGEQFADQDVGTLEHVYMSDFESDGSFMTVYQAKVDDVDHLLFLQQGEQRGILDAHYVTARPDEEQPEQIIDQSIQSGSVEPFEVDGAYARGITIDSEERTLDQVQHLPDAYKAGKMLVYLPGGRSEEQEAFDQFVQESPSRSDEEVFSFCRGEMLSTMSNYIPLCAFEEHDPGRAQKKAQPMELCDSFLQRLKRRFRHIGYLLFLNQNKKQAEIAIEARRRISSSAEREAPVRDALAQNLEEFQQEFEMNAESVPDRLVQLFDSANEMS